jgi:uncharacterized protein (TIGR02246 family)
MSRSHSMILPLAAFLVVGFSAACADQTAQKPAPPPDTRKADEAAIRAASADWTKASQARDLDKAVSYYAEDAVFFVDKGALVKGKNSIRMAWKDFLAPTAPVLSFTTSFVEVARSGDIAYEYGTAEFTTTDKKGKPSVEKGKYVTVWRKQPDGSWKAIIDIDNSGI